MCKRIGAVAENGVDGSPEAEEDRRVIAQGKGGDVSRGEDAPGAEDVIGLEQVAADADGEAEFAGRIRCGWKRRGLVCGVWVCWWIFYVKMRQRLA